MSSEIKSIIKVACTYMATIIGAGFASGQEIVQFFSSYNKGGFIGILLAGLMFALIGYIVLDRVYKYRIRNYDELLFPAVGWKLGWLIEIIVIVFMLSLFCIMIAGSGNIFLTKLGIPYNFGIVLMAFVCMIVILTDIKGVVTLSTIITPILIIGIVAVGIFVIVFKDTTVFSTQTYFSKMTNNYLFSSLLYVGYNSIIALVVLSSLLPQLKTRNTGRIGGLLGGVMLCLVALILNLAIFVYQPSSMTKELPVLTITEQFGNLLSAFYAVVLWLAMFISAVTAGYSFIDRVGSKISINKKILTIIMCAVAVPLSNIGFSSLIATIYPIFGYVGLFIVLVIIIPNVKILPNFHKKNKQV